MAQEEQHLSWGPSANGRFTTKLAYALLMEDTHQAVDFNWCQIWRLKGPPRYSLNLWMATHDCLKTKVLLWKWNIVKSATCDLCGGEAESTLHAIRDCTVPRQIWHLLLPWNSWRNFWTATDTKVWTANELSMLNREQWSWTLLKVCLPTAYSSVLAMEEPAPVSTAMATLSGTPHQNYFANYTGHDP